LVSEAKGHRFESCRARHLPQWKGICPVRQGRGASARSRVKTLTRLLGGLTLADLTVEALEAFKCIRMGSGHGPARGGKQDDPPRETRYRLKGRAKRLVEAGEKEKATVSSQSCRHEVMLLQRAVRW
jgi:hypothetical protein